MAVVIILAVLISSCTMAPTQPYSADTKPPFYRSDKEAITYGPVSFERLEEMKNVVFSSPHPRDFKLFRREGGIVGIEPISADSVNQMFPDFGHYSTVLESCGYTPVADYYAVKINGMWFNGETEICVRRFKSNNPKIALFVYLAAGFGYKKPAYSLIVPVTPDSQAYYVLYGTKDKNGDLVMLPFDVILTDPAARENTRVKNIPKIMGAFVELLSGLSGSQPIDNYSDCPYCNSAKTNYEVEYQTLSGEIILITLRTRNYIKCCPENPVAKKDFPVVGFATLESQLQSLVDLTDPCKSSCKSEFSVLGNAVNMTWNTLGKAKARYEQAQKYCSQCIGTYFRPNELKKFIELHRGGM